MNYNHNHPVPCGGWKNAPSLGGCSNQSNKSISEVQKWDNVTKVYSASVAIDPCVSLVNTSLPSCANTPTCDCNQCEPWGSSSVVPCNGDETMVDMGSGFFNCFKPNTGSFNFSRCLSVGFKNLQGIKYWQGQFGPMSEVWVSAQQTATQLKYWNGTCPLTDPQWTPDQTKYLSKSGSADVHQHQDAWTDGGGTYHPAVDLTANVSRHTTINRYTGKRHHDNSGCGDTNNDSASLSTAMTILGYVDFNVHDLVGKYETLVGGMGVAPTGKSGEGTGVLDCYWNDGSGNKIYEVQLNIAGGTLQLDTWGWVDCLQTVWAHTGTEIWSLTTTTVGYSLNSEVSGGCGSPAPPIVTTTNAGSFYFSNPYTAHECQEDMFSVMYDTQWYDQSWYPWREDGYVTVAPIVGYDEVNESLTFAADCSDTGSTSFTTGVEKGNNASSGYWGSWDLTHPTWRKCQDPITLEWGWYRYSVGAKSHVNETGFDETDAYMPMTANWWTDNFTATTLPQGAWVDYNNFVVGAFTCQMFAATTLPLIPSYNWARPFGEDRYMFEQSTVRCLESFNTSSKTIVCDQTGSAPTFSSTSSIMICGTNTELDGGWTSLTFPDSYTITLGTRLFSGSAYTPTEGYCGGGRVGQLRYPLCPAIGGYISMSAVTVNPNQTVTCVLKEASFLRDGDQVRVLSVEPNQGSPSINGVWNVIVTDDQHIILSGSNAQSGSYKANTGVMKSVFGVDDYWNDFRPKGTFVIKEWQFNYRDVGETDAYNTAVGTEADPYTGLNCYSTTLPDVRAIQAANGMPAEVNNFVCWQECVDSSTCAPSSVVIGTGSWQNPKYIFQMPYVLGDEIYGSRWQADIQLWMEDPLYQAPHITCLSSKPDTGLPGEATYGWAVDPVGNCSSPTTDEFGEIITDYYPQPPMVEAVCHQPTGSPMMPTGITVGCALYADLQTASYSGPSVCSPPAVVGAQSGEPPYPNTSLQPWQRYINEMNCCCISGRFSTDYCQQAPCSKAIEIPLI